MLTVSVTAGQSCGLFFLLLWGRGGCAFTRFIAVHKDGLIPGGFHAVCGSEIDI